MLARKKMRVNSLVNCEPMLATLQDLVRHKAFADAAYLKAIRAHPKAAADPDLRTKLHHIVISDRYWLFAHLGVDFDPETERAVPDSLDEIAARFKDAHTRELDWIATVTESDLTRTVGATGFPVSQALLQVCLHSQGHRAQCATRLREVGGTPPPTDFIRWVKQRPAPDWT
jgi:uncharacterized damage-inducible protein DinB